MEGGWQNNRQLGIHPDNRMVENIFEELDAPANGSTLPTNRFYTTTRSRVKTYPKSSSNLRSSNT